MIPLYPIFYLLKGDYSCCALLAESFSCLVLLLAPDSLKRVFVVRSSPSCAISYAAAGLRQVALCMLDVDIWGGVLEEVD